MRNRGATLIEILIVTMICLLGFWVVGGALMAYQGGYDLSQTEAEAGAFVRKLTGQDVSVACVARDTDGDGYISCSYGLDGRVRSIECAAPWSWNSGCRKPKPSITGYD